MQLRAGHQLCQDRSLQVSALADNVVGCDQEQLRYYFLAIYCGLFRDGLRMRS